MKSGIDFVPLEVHLDTKWQLIEAEFGLTGFAVVVKLLQRIYGQEGYYCDYNEEVALLFTRECGLGGSVVSEIVAAAVRRGIFDKEVFEKYHVLTSRGIQERYFKAVDRRETTKVDRRYLLVPIPKKLGDVYISSENVDIYKKNADISPLTKLKETKENKEKYKRESAAEKVRKWNGSGEGSFDTDEFFQDALKKGGKK